MSSLVPVIFPVISYIDLVNSKPYPGHYHCHYGIEMLFVHEGSGKVTVNEQRYDMRPGRLFFFQPLQIHTVKAEVEPAQHYRRTIVKFDPAAVAPYIQPFSSLVPLFDELWKGRLNAPCIDLEPENRFLSDQLSSLDYVNRLARHERVEAFSIFLLSFLDRLRLQYKDQLFLPSHSSPARARYAKQIVQWLDARLSKEFRLDELADSLHLSKHHVSRQFKAEMGVSIQDYLLNRRIQKASWLLQTTGQTIEQVAEAIGFANPSYFCKVFKKSTGLSPLQFKKQSAGSGASAAADPRLMPQGRG